jgi:integrase
MIDRNFAGRTELDRQLKKHRESSKLPVELTDRKNTGLMVRVRLKNATAWFVYKVNGQKHRIQLGEYPAVTLDKLRDRRDREAGRLGDEAQLNPHEFLAEQKREADSAKAAVDADLEHDTWTVKKLALEYFEYNRKFKRDRTASEIERHFDRYVFPIIGDMPVVDVTADTVRNEVLSVAYAGEHVTQRNAVRVTLSGYFSWVAVPETKRNGWPANLVASHLHGLTNPIRNIAVMRPPKAKRGSPTTREKAALTREESQALYRLLKACRGDRWADAVRLQLLCGTRVSETVLAESKHINWSTRTWKIPAEHSKNGTEHTVELSDPAFELLKSRKGSGLIFPETRIDSTNKQLKKHLAKMKLTEELAQYGTHSLRKAAATGMSELGYSDNVIDHVLNHVIGTKLQRAYRKTDYAPEARDALANWGAFLDADNVVELGRRA